MMRRSRLVLWLVLLAPAAAPAADREVRGRVLDAEGRPVAGADVGPWWAGNGTGKRPDGSSFDLSKSEEVREFWGHLGRMDPRGRSSARTDDQGRFALKVPPIFHNLMAMDRDRRIGGIAPVPKAPNDDPLEIRLGPLVRVRASFEGPDGKRPYWTNVYVETLPRADRPIDSDRLAHCGGFEALFDVLLPPGEYRLHAYGESVKEGDAPDIGIEPYPTLIVPAGVRELDLGRLRMEKLPPGLDKRKEAARAAGTWGDYTKHYGEPPPPPNVADARGVAKDVKLADYRGKWLLVYFWGTGCPSCIGTGIPKLMRFDEEHAKDRDRFAILSVFIDYEGTLRSMDDVDRKLAPIVEHVWKGRSPKFPILLDPTFLTWERYGLPGLGTTILIDPDGNLAEGDEATLADRLKR